MSKELFRCTLCDDDVEKQGRYGHIKFSDGNGHGPKGDVPDDADDYFMPLESDEGEPSDSDEDVDEGVDEDSDEGNDDGAEDSPGQSSGHNSEETTTLWEKLNTPIHELL